VAAEYRAAEAQELLRLLEEGVIFRGEGRLRGGLQRGVNICEVVVVAWVVGLGAGFGGWWCQLWYEQDRHGR
jgi:hypothetical protein